MGILSWWYGRGWIARWHRVTDQWRATVEFFSIGQLLATLFSPFRQISAAPTISSNPAVALRAFLDRLISRIIGSIVRAGTIVAGCLVILIQVVFQSVLMVLWLFTPLLPIIGFVLLALGWAPAWI